jgi:phenylalanyl-tRNA synthetase beta chain
LSDDHDGIIDLPEDAPVGSSFAAYAGLDDPVIEIGLTPNRPTAPAFYGIARDLAAAGLGKLKAPKCAGPVAGRNRGQTSRSRSPMKALPRLRLAAGQRREERRPPAWMQQRLIAIGLRPINALVDITNYVTFDRGRPLHVFDAGKVAGNLVVRRALDGEKSSRSTPANTS